MLLLPGFAVDSADTIIAYPGRGVKAKRLAAARGAPEAGFGSLGAGAQSEKN